MYATEYIFRAKSAWTYKQKREKLIIAPAWTWGGGCWCVVLGEGTTSSKEREGKEREQVGRQGRERERNKRRGEKRGIEMSGREIGGEREESTFWDKMLES